MKRAGQPPHDAKRPRAQADEDEDEDMLDMDAMLDDGPPEPYFEEEGAAADFVTLGAAFMGRSQKWSRPPVVGLVPAQHALSMQNFEADYRIDKPIRELGPGSNESKVAVVRLYGVTAEGHSVLMHVHGFLAYFYVPTWPGFEPSQAGSFFNALNNKVRANMGRDAVTNPVLKVEVVQRQSLMHYSQGGGSFLMITMALPTLVPTARRLLEVWRACAHRPLRPFLRCLARAAWPRARVRARSCRACMRLSPLATPPLTVCSLRGGRPPAQSGFELPGHPYGFPFQTFESNFPFVLRFMVDTSLQGCAWLTAPANAYKLRPWTARDGTAHSPTSTCQIEVDVHYTALQAHAAEGEWLKIAPFSVLSLDIECAGRPGVFPEADKDPVIQIANHVTVNGSATSKLRCILTLNHCAPIADAEVRCRAPRGCGAGAATGLGQQGGAAARQHESAGELHAVAGRTSGVPAAAARPAGAFLTAAFGGSSRAGRTPRRAHHAARCARRAAQPPPPSLPARLCRCCRSNRRRTCFRPGSSS